MDKTKLKKLIPLLVIIIIACFFRLWQINNIPGGLFPDEAANGQDALLILDGYHTPFFEKGLGREALYFYLLAISVKFFGLGVWHIHFVSAIIGVLTVIATWLLGKQLFNQRIAFFASFFVAISTWHIVLSRTGFRAILIPLISTLAIYFIFLILKENSAKKRALWAILSGAFFGLGFYTYISYRAMIAIIGLLAVILLIINRNVFKKYWRDILVAIISMLIVISPLSYYFYTHPDSFIGRAGCVSIFNPDLNNGSVIGTFLSVAKDTLLMFFTKGDLNWRHNVSGFSMLNPLVGILFALFIFKCFFVLFKEKFWKIKNLRDKIIKPHFKYVILIVWFFGMLGPTMMTAEAIPHSLRSIGALPIVFFFPAVILDFFYRKIRDFKFKNSKVFANALLGIFLMTISIYNFNLYFGVSANSAEFHYAYRSDLTIASKYLNERNLKEKTFLVLDDYSVQTPDFLTSENSQPYILLDPAKSYKAKPKIKDQIIFTQSTIFDSKKFEEFHPNARLIIREFNRFSQEIMRVYEII
jgi:4-amino-4-deoxy-L-arabinose transferase-like glycosyltransferase